MKNKMTLSLVALGGMLIAGCGDSSKQTAPGSSGSTPPPTASEDIKKAATEVAKEVSTEAKKQVTEAAAEVKKQTTETVAEVQKQATVAYQDFSSQLSSSLQSSSDSLLKNISTDLGSRVSKLGESLESNETVKAQLNSAMESLLGKKDSEAVGSFGKLTESKLTPDQTALAKDAYNAAAALVTQRNFSSLEGMNTEVTGLVNSVWKGNYTEALPPLQKIWTKATLTESQRNLLGTTFDKVAPGWRDSAAKLQQGTDLLKKFTK